MSNLDRFFRNLEKDERRPGPRRQSHTPAKTEPVRSVDYICEQLKEQFPLDSDLPEDNFDHYEELKIYVESRWWEYSVGFTREDIRKADCAVMDLTQRNYSNSQIYIDAFTALIKARTDISVTYERIETMKELALAVRSECKHYKDEFYGDLHRGDLRKAERESEAVLEEMEELIYEHHSKLTTKIKEQIYRKVAEIIYRNQCSLPGLDL